VGFALPDELRLAAERLDRGEELNVGRVFPQVLDEGLKFDR